MAQSHNLCEKECSSFYSNPGKNTLGDIKKENSCSYCLYWNANAATPEKCSCAQVFESKTGMGSKMDMTDYCNVGDCLNSLKLKKEKKDPTTDCMNLYKGFFGNSDSKTMLGKTCVQNTSVPPANCPKDWHVGVM